MRNQIELKRDGARVVFSDPHRDAKGWLESYRVSLATTGLSAEVRVENPPYGLDPTHFTGELARNWSGWTGEKGWRSMESELDLIAVTDRLGHITVTVSVRPDPYPAVWRAQLSIQLDAGELDQVHRWFREFFWYPPAA